MAYDDTYFRRALQSFGTRLGPFTGQVLMAINGGRLCKLELLYKAKLQCTNQRQDSWAGPNGTVVLTLGGAATAARRSFEAPLREREGDHAELVANYSDGRLDDFRYIGKAR